MNYKNQTTQAEEKEKRIASAVGLFVNLLLAAAKIAVGLLSGLISIVADGVNNLSDGGSCLVALVSYRIAAKPADKDHPYGHQRAEYIASLCISFLVLALGVELLRESFGKIMTGSDAQAGLFVFLVLAVSVLVKAGMFVFYRHFAKRTNSDVLYAAATDSACDCLATLAAALGAVLCRFDIPADGWVGILVAIFIFWQGLKILRDASSKLLGQAPPRDLVLAIKEFILQEEGVFGLHDLKVYPYGPHKVFATVHIETDASQSAICSHELLDGIERKVKAEFDVELTAHLDPVALDDSEAEDLKQRVFAAVEGMVEGMNLHDFRLVRGAKIKVVFEVAVPFSCEKNDNEIQNDICRAVRVLGNYEPVVTVERE